MLSRRKFLTTIVPGLVVSSIGFLYGSVSAGSCPLSNEGYCVGPCSAFRDPNGDSICDRLPLILESETVADAAPPEAAIEATATATATLAAAPTITPMPQNRANQPSAPSPTQRPTQLPTPRPSSTPAQAAPRTACPFGLVNDRYPGRCRRYVDRDGNGICDLSEPSRSG